MFKSDSHKSHNLPQRGLADNTTDLSQTGIAATAKKTLKTLKGLYRDSLTHFVNYIGETWEQVSFRNTCRAMEDRLKQTVILNE